MVSDSFVMHPSVPQGLTLALYKGVRPGAAGIANRVGRYLDGGPYSHTELILSNRVSISSSFVDKGVRAKNVGYSSVGCWDFLRIPDPTGQLEVNAINWYLEHVGCEYDVWGNIRFGIGFARQSEDKWFCSESNAAMLGHREPWRYGPSGLLVLEQAVRGSELITVERVV